MFFIGDDLMTDGNNGSNSIILFNTKISQNYLLNKWFVRNMDSNFFTFFKGYYGLYVPLDIKKQVRI